MEFRSAQAALRWAYQTMAGDICKTSGLYSSSPGSGGDLNEREKHAQAAQIVAMIERQLGSGSPGMAYLIMQYGRNATHIGVLVNYAAAGLATGFNSRRGIEKCIRSYCGQTIGIHAIRTDLRISLKSAQDTRRDVFGRMDSLHRITIGQIDEVLRQAGLIAEV
jgi:hypothetical protein